MTLKQCTREELIFVIERLMFYSLSNEHYLHRALNDVEDQRFEKKMEECRRLLHLASQKSREYVELMKPYEGKPISDVPSSVLKKAGNLLKESTAADMRWKKLMGIDMTPGRNKRHGKTHD